MSMEASKFDVPLDYTDKQPGGIRTKQAFKDSTDINKILAKVAAGESITHLAKHGAVYGDFSDIDDLLTGMQRLRKADEIFADLPGEIRQEFDQSPRKFFNFVNDPANADRLDKLLPDLTAKGRQLQSINRAPHNIEQDLLVKEEAAKAALETPPEAAPTAPPDAPPTTPAE